MRDDKTINELIELIAAGDEMAMREVYLRMAPSISSFVSGWLSDPSQALDIVHETMLIVWRKAGSFENRSSPKTWIFGIARNKALEHNRSGARIVVQDDVISENVADTDDPHITLELLDDAEMIRDCVEELSNAHRRAIQLCFFEGLSYAEISQVESCPVGTVKTRIMHAKKLIQRCISSKTGAA